MRVYVASSWRNPGQPLVVGLLRGAGHEVYDFRNPGPGDLGFHWHDAGLDDFEEGVEAEDLNDALSHPSALRGFDSDYAAMLRSDACVLVLPAGASAHLEAGFMAGLGRTVVPVCLSGRVRPELMYLAFGPRVCLSRAGLLDALDDADPAPREA